MKILWIFRTHLSPVIWQSRKRSTILRVMIYRFAEFELDLAKKELLKGGKPVAVEPQVFVLIAFLIEHRERVVSREEILEKVWEGRVVSDSALSSRIKSARQALGDSGKLQHWIKTSHSLGFRFHGTVEVEHTPAPVAPINATVATVIESVVPAKLIVPAEAETITNKPSIAVLPFRVIGDAGPYATISQGLPQELITELARLRWLFVIARGSSFRVQQDQMGYPQIGQTLGVRYCLAGTVEVIGTRLNVTTELVDARSDMIIWAERFSGLVDDVQAMRDEIRSKVLSALELQIPLHEANEARLTGTESLDAWSAYHLGLQYLYRFNHADNTKAAELFELSLKRDPNFARAHAGISSVHFHNAFMRQSDDLTAEIKRAREFARRGVEIDPLDPFVNFTMGRSYWLDAGLDEALSWLQRSVSLSPNFAQGNYAWAWTQIITGQSSQGRQNVDLAMQLSPLDPLHYAMLAVRGISHIVDDEYDEAAHWAIRSATAPGAHVLIAMIAAATSMLAGNTQQAQDWADNARTRRPGISQIDFFHAFPIRTAGVREKLAQALTSLKF